MREIEPPPLVLVGDTLEYEVEGILWHQGKGARHQYLVLWKGYPLTEATWEPESHLANTLDILEEYLCAGSRHRIERSLNVVVCHLGDDDSKVLPLRTGSDGVGTSAIGDRRVDFRYRSRPSSS